MAAAWSMWLESREVNYEANKVSRSSVEAVDGGVLRMAACRETVWWMRSGMLCRYVCIWGCVRNSVNEYSQVKCGLWEGVSGEGGLAMMEKGAGITM